MQRLFNDEIHLRQMVNPSEYPQKVKSIDCLSDFNSITKKMTKLRRFLKDGV